MKIKVRTKEQQAIDNLKAIVNSKGKKIEIEPPVEDTAQILLDYISNLEDSCKDKVDRYQEMIIEYCKLDKKYKKDCETYQQALDETISEKMDLEEQIKKALKVLKNEDGTIPDYKIIENALEVLKGVEDE